MIIYINVRKYKINLNIENKLFSYLVKGNLLVLVVDISRSLINGRVGEFFYNTNVFLTYSLLLISPVVPMVWTIYIDHKIFTNTDRIRKHMPFLLLPIFINTFFIFLGFVDGTNGRFLFFIDQSNRYVRGELYGVMFLLSCLYFIYSLVSIKLNKKIIEKTEYNTLLLFTLPPLIGGMIQFKFFQLQLTWISMTISLFIIYINIQNKLLYIDVLTNLYNRRSLNKHFKSLFQNKTKGYFVGGILLDLNDFKIINDTFGHDEGDKALRIVGSILKSTFHEDLVFRYAGDEFVVMCKVKDTNQLQMKIKMLEKNIEKFNRLKKTPYLISMSKGYYMFKEAYDVSLENFIGTIDSLMYKDKFTYKSQLKKRHL